LPGPEPRALAPLLPLEVDCCCSAECSDDLSCRRSVLGLGVGSLLGVGVGVGVGAGVGVGDGVGVGVGVSVGSS